MALLRGLALFLLCLVGYSAAAVGSAGERPPRPAGWELLVSGVAATVAVVVAPELAGHWLGFPLAVAMGAVPGALTGLLRRPRGGRGQTGGAAATASRRPPEDDASEVGGLRGFLLRLGDFQGRITMGYLYFLLLAPFSAVRQILRDPFEPTRDDDSSWSPRSTDADEGPGEPLTRQY